MDARTIRQAAGECLKRVDLSRRLRLLGVRAGALATLADLVAPQPAPIADQTLAVQETRVNYSLPLFESLPESAPDESRADSQARAQDRTPT
jgi:DNA polymerase-4